MNLLADCLKDYSLCKLTILQLKKKKEYSLEQTHCFIRERKQSVCALQIHRQVSDWPNSWQYKQQTRRRVV